MHNKLPLNMVAGVMGAVLALGGCASDSSNDHPAPLSATRTILMVWDGLRPDSVNAADTPNLFALRQSGVNFVDNHSTYPTFTMMNGSSLATGSFPKTSGFYGNTFWAAPQSSANTIPVGNSAAGTPQDYTDPVFTEDYQVLTTLNDYYGGQLLLVKSLFATAQAAGLVTATVGKSGAAYIQDLGKGGLFIDENTVQPRSLVAELQTAGFTLPANVVKSYSGTDAVTLNATNGSPTSRAGYVTFATTAYDPTCGSGGLLLNAVLELKNKGKEWRNVRVYGQEINLITSGIARMNMFLQDKDRFDVVLANPPYSVKQWNQTRFAADPYGRNRFGTPPQGNADYAFLQHVIASLNTTGRAAILFPHGVLFRDAEVEMRRKMLEADLIEGVIGLGPNLFYNSPMEACILVLRRHKPDERRGQITLVDGSREVMRVQAYSFLSPANEQKILAGWQSPDAHPDIARVVTLEEIAERNFNLSIPLYIDKPPQARLGVGEALSLWEYSRSNLAQQTAALFALLGSSTEESQRAD